MGESAILKHLSVVLLLFFGYKCYPQDLNVNLQKLNDSANTNIYTLEAFNNFSKPIAIRVSTDFIKFSKLDTLDLAIGEWPNSNGKDYYFRIDRSVSDGQDSHSKGYQLLILNPQTYLLVNVNLTDYNKYKNKSLWFSVAYSDILTNEDSIYLNRPVSIHWTRDFIRPFKKIDIKLN